MYTLPENIIEAFSNQIKADNRKFSVKLNFTSPIAQEFTGTTIQSISVDEVVNSTDALTLGCACSNKIVVDLIDTDEKNPLRNFNFEDGVFTAHVGLKIDKEYVYVPLGEFYVTNVETSNDFKSLKLTGYDGFCKLSGVYEGSPEPKYNKLSYFQEYVFGNNPIRGYKTRCNIYPNAEFKPGTVCKVTIGNSVKEETSVVRFGPNGYMCGNSSFIGSGKDTGENFLVVKEDDEAFTVYCDTTENGLNWVELTYETGETTLKNVCIDLKQKLNKFGISFNYSGVPEYSFKFSNIKDITYQQAIGYIAGCCGGFARFNREGDLEIATYPNDVVLDITRDLQYLNGFKKTIGKSLTITSITTGTKEKPIVRGDGVNGTEITFENPYITEGMADTVWEKFNGVTYTPCELKWRGNPLIQAGDVVCAEDRDGNPHIVLIMNQSIKISGGLSSTIECTGNTEATSNFSTKLESTGQKIERLYKTLEQAIINATNAITGNSGGYVIVHDAEDDYGNTDGYPDEILIMNTNDISTATQVWRWNQEGLGFSDNGYKGPYNTAITADGQIVADMITTGRLNANLVSIGDATLGEYVRVENNAIYLGEKDNPMSMRVGKNSLGEDETESEYQVAFYNGDKKMAYFSGDSFVIEDITDGLIRFQNFGFIPRKSGNLTFTKIT